MRCAADSTAFVFSAGACGRGFAERHVRPLKEHLLVVGRHVGVEALGQGVALRRGMGCG